jgi:uncharacterized membrane protein YagU involved in acid resistance
MLPPSAERRTSLAASSVRGVVGAMAQTGVRRVTTGLGLVRRPPPERLAVEGVPKLLSVVSAEHRDEAIELAHWFYGAAAGALYATLPRSFRRKRWSGSAYGLAVWLFFETVLGPALLGLERSRRRPLAERLATAADHALYGAVVGGRKA